MRLWSVGGVFRLRSSGVPDAFRFIRPIGRAQLRPRLAILTREGTAQVAPCISEYGFYSVFLGDGKSVYLSEHAGHLMRTKALCRVHAA